MLMISQLVNCPQHLHQVACWIFEEWGYLIEGLTIEKVEARLQTHLHPDTIPLTLVASQNQHPVGTASLVFEDMSSRPDLSPWLASVYVFPEYRKQGIGSALVSAVEEIGKKLNVRKLYLFTPDQQRFYARLGWLAYEQTEYRGRLVVVMNKSL